MGGAADHGTGRLRRLVPWLAAGLVPATVLAGGPAWAGAPAGTISTVIGGPGGPGRATTVSLDDCGVTFHHGHLYVADGPAVRGIAASGRLTTPVGSGISVGPSGDGGLATAVDLYTCEVTLDPHGNLVIADDARNHLLIQVAAASTGTFYGQAMTVGPIYTVAGTGIAGYSGDGGPATRAKLDGPQTVAVDGAGNLVIPGFFNNRLRVVAVRTGRFYRVAMTAGDIYSVAGDGGAGYAGDGGPGTAARVWLPVGRR
jgi:hypothetical protein